MRNTHRVVLLTLAVCGAAACGGGSDDDDDAAPREGYPPEPYGVAEGDILEALDFTTPDGGTFSLRDVYADGNKRVLLVSTAAGWCTSCAEEQPELQQRHETFSGLFVLVSLFEDADYAPADAQFAQRWVDQHDVTFQVVADPDFQWAPYYDTDLTPMNMVVEVDTMRILRITTGWDPSVIDALIEGHL